MLGRSADADGHCEDSTSWYKKDDTEKNCAWVAKLPDSRCAVKSSDKTLAAHDGNEINEQLC